MGLAGVLNREVVEEAVPGHSYSYVTAMVA
jgi:hypothetical protein